MYKKLLITGQMRSGTTLLCNFLNTQKNVTMYADIFHTVAGRVPDPRGWGFSKINYLDRLPHTQKYYILFSISHGIDVLKTANNITYQVKVDPDAFNTMKELYDILLESIAKDGDLIVGNKVTSCEINIVNLLLQTDIKVLYIHRDARDVVRSASKKFNRPIDEYISAWNSAMDIIISVNSPNFCRIKFEDLISKSPEVKEKLDNFLGIDVTFELENLLVFDSQWVANSSFGDVKTVFDKTSAYRWKKDLSDEVRRIDQFCKDRLVKLGYEPM